MYASARPARRLPQRVVVAGFPAEPLAAFLERLAAALDVPLVPLAEVSGPAELARLAAFDGWVTTAEDAWARPTLLERAELLVRAELEAASFAGRVRRTLRRIRAEGREPDLGWVDQLAPTHPEVAVVRLPDPDAAEAWLRSLG